MKKVLPARANIEHLKSQAKDLLEAFRRGDAAARERFRESLPAARGAADAELAALQPALHDAHSVIAREYGFKSFGELKAALDQQQSSPGYLRELMQRQMTAPLPFSVLGLLRNASAMPRAELSRLPSSFPLVPLRNALLAKGALAPLSIARAESRAAIDRALAQNGWIAVFAQKEIDNAAPELGDLHPVGVAAKVLATEPHEDGLWIVVRGEEWIRLDAISQRSPYLLAVTSRFTLQPHADLGQLADVRSLRELAIAVAGTLPGGEALATSLEELEASELADTVVANLPVSVEQKAAYAAEPDVLLRVQWALAGLQRAGAPAP